MCYKKMKFKHDKMPIKIARITKCGSIFNECFIPYYQSTEAGTVMYKLSVFLQLHIPLLRFVNLPWIAIAICSVYQLSLFIQ